MLFKGKVLLLGKGWKASHGTHFGQELWSVHPQVPVHRQGFVQLRSGNPELVFGPGSSRLRTSFSQSWEAGAFEVCWGCQDDWRAAAAFLCWARTCPLQCGRGKNRLPRRPVVPLMRNTKLRWTFCGQCLSNYFHKLTNWNIFIQWYPCWEGGWWGDTLLVHYIRSVPDFNTSVVTEVFSSSRMGVIVSCYYLYLLIKNYNANIH